MGPVTAIWRLQGCQLSSGPGPARIDSLLSPLTFSPLLRRHGGPVPGGLFDHLHAEYGPELGLRAKEYFFETPALGAENCHGSYQILPSLPPLKKRRDGPFSLSASLRIGVREYSQASAYLTSFVTSWPSPLTSRSTSMVSSSSSSNSESTPSSPSLGGGPSSSRRSLARELPALSKRWARPPPCI